MKTVKRIGTIAIVLAIIILGALQLKQNKKTIRETATLASTSITEIPIKVSQPQTATLSQEISATGILSAHEELTVLSETQGKITKVNKNVGDYVRKNDVIVEVEDETIAAQVLVAEANFEQQQKDIERYERLEKGDAIARHDLEQAKIALKKAEADLISARKALRDTKIKAPISGIVNRRMVEYGQFISGGMPICEIVNTSKLKIWIKVPEKDIFKLKKGQNVSIAIPALPGQEFTGKINSLGEKADNAMKFDAEVAMDNPGGHLHLKAGLFAEISIPGKATPTLVIEKAALVGSMTNPSVFVVNESNMAVKRNIVTHNSDEKFVEVLKGLQVTDQVVVSGQLNLQDGSRVKIIQ